MFDDLPYFLQDYVVSSGWASLNDIQERAWRIMVETDGNVLISAGTSGGKTEAAFFPVIASMHADNPKGVGALYISPLKALIDDQNERLARMLRETDISVSGWHGDVSTSKKEAVREDPSGILQITPESLQGMILYHSEDLRRMFPDLRFIVIDEIHSFLGSTRGLQLICVLVSMLRLTGCTPRVIGLSATISDIRAAARWLSSINGLSTGVIRDDAVADHTIRVHYHRFPMSDDGPRGEAIEEYYERMFTETDPYNCIVFVNSRLKAEVTSRSLSDYSSYVGSSKKVAIHHGSVSKEIRKDAEAKLKSKDFKATLVATTTLELGIDVGDIERIVQLEPPYSSSSFVQRMGRSGRRTGHPVMIMMCSDDDEREYERPMGFSVSLARSLAMIDLYEREHWVEPMEHTALPYGLLFQQMLVAAAVYNGVSREGLVRSMRGMYPFWSIPAEDFEILISDMVENDYLHVVPDTGILVVGDKGGRMMDPRTILAVFEDDNDYPVTFGDKTVGYLPRMPYVGGKVLLGGRAWVVKEVERRSIRVEPVGSDAVTRWSSGIPKIHTKVVRAMRDILIGGREFPELDEGAGACLARDRDALRDSGVGTGVFVDRGQGSVSIYPWLGTVQFDTLQRLIGRIEGVKVVNVVPLYRIDLVTDMGIGMLRQRIEDERRSVDPSDLLEKGDALVSEKFDRYVPRVLLEKKFVRDNIDLSFDLTG